MVDRNSEYKSLEAVIICRCEGITLSQIQSAIHQSDVKTINQLKKLTRAGMGPCQGHICSRVAETIFSIEAKSPPGTEPYLSRPPVRGLSVGMLATGSNHFDEPTGPVRVAKTRIQAAKTSSEHPQKKK